MALDRTVMKFGGSILSTKEDLQRIAELVKKRNSNGGELCVVVSALKGVTDSLIEASEKSANGQENIGAFISGIRAKHLELLRQLGNGKAREIGARKITERIARLEKALNGISNLGELSERSRAFVCTFGERLSAVILEAWLLDNGVKAIAIDADEIIETDSNFGQASPIMEKTIQRAEEKILPLLGEKTVPIITGYFGANENGFVTCFGRGGSDFSAGILANALNATALELWKDVDGFLSADPKSVENAKFLETISYEEAEELGFFRAKILHPRAIAPIREKGIRAMVKNIRKPDAIGTVISEEKKELNEIVKSIAVRKGIAAIYLKSAEMVNTPGMLAKIFSSLAEAGISVDLVSTSETGVSITIGQSEMEKAKEALQNCPIKFEAISFEEDIAMVSAIGEGMRGKPGIAGKIFGALGREGINVEIISQGSSEINLSFVVKASEAEKAVKAVHKSVAEENALTNKQ